MLRIHLEDSCWMQSIQCTGVHATAVATTEVESGDQVLAKGRGVTGTHHILSRSVSVADENIEIRDRSNEL